MALQDLTQAEPACENGQEWPNEGLKDGWKSLLMTAFGSSLTVSPLSARERRHLSGEGWTKEAKVRPLERDAQDESGRTAIAAASAI
jgi:hypothetical protein